jgi:hypothetical protein
MPATLRHGSTTPPIDDAKKEKRLHMSDMMKNVRCKEKMQIWAAPPCMGRFPKPARKKVGTKADNHISGTKADRSTNPAFRKEL